MSVSFDVFDVRLEFHDDLKKYYALSCAFQSAHDDAYKSVKNDLAVKKEPADILKKTEENVKGFVGGLINQLSNYGVFDKTVGDYLNENMGYIRLLNACADYYEFAEKAAKRSNAEAEESKKRANAVIRGAVSGLDFGIISDSVIEHAIYSAMNNAQVRKQSQQALERMRAVSDVIDKNREDRISEQIDEYYINEYIPKFSDALSQLYGQLLALYVRELDLCGRLNSACMEGIYIQRSNEIISNIDKVENKRGVFIKALELCPYNANVYIRAYTEYLYPERIDILKVCGDLIKYFELEEKLKDILDGEEVQCDCAKEHLRKREYKSAKDAYEKITRIYPDNYKGWLGLLLCKTRQFSMVAPNSEEAKRIYSKVRDTMKNEEDMRLAENAYDRYMDNNYLLERLKKKTDALDREFYKEHEDIYSRDMTGRMTVALIGSLMSVCLLFSSLVSVVYLPIFFVLGGVSGGMWCSLVRQDKEIKRCNQEKQERLEKYNADIKKLTNNISAGSNMLELL